MIHPIKDRLAAAYHPGIDERELMRLVFPEEQFPNAWRRATKGGPPGCLRSFVASLKRHGYDSNAHRKVWRVRA